MKGQMRRLTAAVLAMVTVGTLVTGCGKKKEKDEMPEEVRAKIEEIEREHNAERKENYVVEAEPEEYAYPTEEEDLALLRYCGIVHGLNSYDNGEVRVECYDDNGDIYVLEDQEAMKYCYEMLPNLECVDKWVGTPFCYNGWDDPELNWNRQELMDGFHVIKDVLVKQNWVWTDAVGNEEGTQNTYYNYDSDGKLVCSRADAKYGHTFVKFGWSVENELLGLPFIYEYDEEETLKKIKLMSNNYVDVAYVIVPEYDSNGNRICDNTVYKNGETRKYEYSYDQNNRLIRVDCDERENYHLTWYYNYDETGRLIKEQKVTPYQTECEIDYVYDGSSVYGICNMNGGAYTETFEATLNEQGNIITYCRTTSSYKYDYTLTYGDYYSYIPVN